MSEKKPIGSKYHMKWKERMKNYVPPPKIIFDKNFIIGYLLAELIWATKMPTLSHRPCGSLLRIQVSEEDIKLESDADDKWYKDQTDENWKAYRDIANTIDEKYMPKEFIFYYPDLFEKETVESDEFKSGIRSALWDTDGCPYSTDKNDIEITIEESINFIKIKFIYKHS